MLTPENIWHKYNVLVANAFVLPNSAVTKLTKRVVGTCLLCRLLARIFP